VPSWWPIWVGIVRIVRLVRGGRITHWMVEGDSGPFSLGEVDFSEVADLSTPVAFAVDVHDVAYHEGGGVWNYYFSFLDSLDLRQDLVSH
jgi:hypothetical protein